MTSASQDQWVEICAAARAALAKQVELIPAMNPGEVASLMTAIGDAMWNEVKSGSHDMAIEERLANLERSKAYGGGNYG
jgi:hypothetical protein